MNRQQPDPGGDLTNRKIERLALMAEVAEALLIEGITQNEAAARFNLSRPSISRLLTEAKELGIVKIEIRRVLQRHTSLESALVEKFGLDQAHVSWVANVQQSNSFDQYIHFAVECVRQQLFSGAIVGITLGRTLGQVIAQLATKDPIDLSLVQLCGSLGSTDEFLDSHALVEALANAYGAKASYLHAPYSVETEAACSLLNNASANRGAIALGRRADFALFGAGTVDPRTASLVQGNHISSKLLKSLQDADAVGDVAGFFLSSDGSYLNAHEFNFWKTGVNFSEFKGIKRRIAIAIGEHKTPVLRAAMQSGFITELITDHTTAAILLGD